MHNHDNISDEIPIADAVEQEQETAFESAAPIRDIPPAEADAFDWQEQLHEVGGADDDREEYRE